MNRFVVSFLEVLALARRITSPPEMALAPVR